MIKFTVDILPNDLLAVEGHYLDSLFHCIVRVLVSVTKYCFPFSVGGLGFFYLPFFIVDFPVILYISA